MRLIDADRLKSQEEMSKVFHNPTDEFYGMLQLIEEQPTVYDVDKIVFELDLMEFIDEEQTKGDWSEQECTGSSEDEYNTVRNSKGE